jgi:hypothetical protein
MRRYIWHGAVLAGGLLACSNDSIAGLPIGDPGAVDGLPQPPIDNARHPRAGVATTPDTASASIGP